MASSTEAQIVKPHFPVNKLMLFFDTCFLLVAPIASFFIFRIKLMSLADLPDPSMHTTYIVDPRSIFTRYATLFEPTARLREGARVGFLVPARAMYLLFGALDGFIVLRYLLILIAIIPLYSLLSSIFNRPIAATGVLLILTNPVVITALGTDYPDGAVICYLVGATCLLALSLEKDHSIFFTVVAGLLLTLALWSHGGSTPYIFSALICYFVLLGNWRLIARTLAVLASSFLATTALLTVLSGVEIGQYDFILPTFESAKFLSTSAQESIWHTSTLGWLLGLPYLLVPVVVAVLSVLFLIRCSSLTKTQIYIFLVCFASTGIAFLLQFFGKFQALENHYFSSMLSAQTLVAITMIVGLFGIRLSAKSNYSWGIFLVVAIIAEVFSWGEFSPAISWWPLGACIGLACVIGASLSLFYFRNRLTILSILTAFLAVLMLLTTASTPNSISLSPLDPRAQYSSALGGSSYSSVSEYIVTSELSHFVGKPSYKGEILLMWFQWSEVPYLLEPIGIYHAGFNSLPQSPPFLSQADMNMISERKAAQILILGKSGDSFGGAMRSLSRYMPKLVSAKIWLFAPIRGSFMRLSVLEALGSSHLGREDRVL
ncbi:MAG: hypothetical protein HKL80_06720 [Acidimicrobiales bacterium]|nr:hypothetical protein [Acidimicrobiales bacterium]